MLRNAAYRGARQAQIASRPTSHLAYPPTQWFLRSQHCTVSRREQTGPRAWNPQMQHSVRWQTSSRPPVDQIDPKREAKALEGALKATPESVSVSSTQASPLVAKDSRRDNNESEDDDGNPPMAAIYQDMRTIRDTFSLDEVPRRAYYMGLAGVVPYAVTSASTVFCAYEIKRAASTGSGLIMSDQTAELLLHVIEPLQIGYGAVIISFLGAIHWGLEWAKYGGEQGYPRYMIGVVSTAFAWPTILIPVEYALISQFLIFNFLYYSDSRASRRGWCPPWYAVYRFVLTFVVGASIVASLVGRGQIAGHIERQPAPSDRIKRLSEWGQQEGETEEEARRRLLDEQDEEDDE